MLWEKISYINSYHGTNIEKDHTNSKSSFSLYTIPWKLVHVGLAEYVTYMPPNVVTWDGHCV